MFWVTVSLPRMQGWEDGVNDGEPAWRAGGLVKYLEYRFFSSLKNARE